MQQNPIIERQEASRLLHAIKFYLKHNPARKPFWSRLLKQLIRSTKREYLVPIHLKQKEWESLVS